MNLFTFLSNILFFFCLFPYLSIVNTGSDTQPFALLCAVTIIGLVLIYEKDVPIPKVVLPFLIVFSYAVVIAFVKSEPSMVIRSLFGYFSVPVLLIAGWLTFEKVKPKLFEYSVMVWLIFGLIQTFVSRGFGSFLLPRASTSLDRGVTSLAVEPSFYSVMCIFFLLLNDLFYSKNSYSKNKYNFLLVIIMLQFALSRSGVGFLLLIGYLSARLVASRDVRKIFTNLFVLGSFSVLTVTLFSTIDKLQFTRLGVLISKAKISPMSLVYTDGSISDRLGHILVSFSGFFKSYGIGYGLGTWDEHALYIAHTSGKFILEVTSVNFTLGRIMSAWGSVFFELGVFGALFLGTYIFIMNRGVKLSKGYQKFVFRTGSITVFIVMMMAVSLSFPLFGYCIGIYALLQSRELPKISAYSDQATQ